MLPTLDPILRTVLNMMASRGGDGTLSVPTGDVGYDPETSQAVPVVRKYPFRGLMFDFLQKNDGAKADGLVQAGDRQLYIKPGTAPRPIPRVDSVEFGGIKYNVVTVKELNPSGGASPILYEVYLRN